VKAGLAGGGCRMLCSCVLDFLSFSGDKLSFQVVGRAGEVRQVLVGSKEGGRWGVRYEGGGGRYVKWPKRFRDAARPYLTPARPA
jgi:hypothetical protein